MDREYSVRVGETETLISVRQTGHQTWLASATRSDGESVEYSSDTAAYALKQVKKFLRAADQGLDTEVCQGKAMW
jgi:hypothetical protein